MNKYLTKIAKAKAQEPEKPHAIEASKQLEDNGGQILHWSVGAGKSRQVLLEVQKALKEAKPHERALIIAPASLTTNITKELKKHGIKLDMDKVDLLSYQKATNDAVRLRRNKYAITVLDEAHSVRNANTKRSRELSDIVAGGKKRILATATGNYNSLSDIAPLINLAAGERVLPEDKNQFEKVFTKEVKPQRTLWEKALNKQVEPVTELQNKAYLKHLFKQYVNYYDSKDDPEARDKFPTMTEKTINVEMSKQQEHYYKFLEDQIPWLLKKKIQHNLPMSQKEKSDLNAFSMGVRQASNSVRHLTNEPNVKYTPKIEAAAARIQKGVTEDKNFRFLTYSNFLESGTNEFSRKLKDLGIKHSVYTGGLSRAEKDKLVEDYNSGKVPGLVVSSSGGEGLSLKGTKVVQLLDQHWNKQKLNQVKGRASRYESHIHLPKEERKVEVEHYLSVFAKPTFGKAHGSIDSYMHGVSDTKQDTFEKMKKLMAESTKENKD